MLASYLDVDALFDVEPDAFDPPPEVRSAIVRLQPNEAHQILDERMLGQVVATAFSQRRKDTQKRTATVIR